MPSSEVIRSLPDQHVPCVLIVEDEPDLAALIRRMLTEVGINSDIASSANEARQLIAERGDCYRLITLDVMLPDEDGISLYKSLREENEDFNIPVVVLSVKADDAKRQLKGGAIGIVDWLSKPIDSKRLIEVVKSTISLNSLPQVLHVEDEKDVHLIVEEMLKDKCEMIWAKTVEQAKEVISQGHLDLVLLDIGLPDGSGLDLIPDIEKSDSPPKVVIFSAMDVPEEFVDKVAGVLVKSSTSNEKLLDVILGAMN